MGASGFKKDTLEKALLAAHIEPTVRAEALGVKDFVRLAMALAEGGAYGEETTFVHGRR